MTGPLWKEPQFLQDIWQSSGYLSSPSFCYHTSSTAQQGNTVRGNANREFDAKKTVNVADIQLTNSNSDR